MSAPERQLAAAIEQLFATLMRERGRLADFDPNPLTPTQRLALAIVAADEPLRLGALAERMGTTEATASRTVDALAAVGLVTRVDDPGDGRAVLIAATAEGRSLLAERRRRFAAFLGRSLAAMPEEETRQLIALLRELNDALGAPQFPVGQMPREKGAP